jgi:hypothetical protein
MLLFEKLVVTLHRLLDLELGQREFAVFQTQLF